MRKYIILFFSVFLFLFACNSNGTPEDIIQKDQMVALLVAVHMADGRLLNLSQAPDTLYKYGTARYLAVFKKFNTDSNQFRKSYQYYSTKPDEFSDIYDKVLKNLQAKNDSVNKLIIKENIARSRKPVKPAVPNSNNKYGVGLQPQVPIPLHGGTRPNVKGALTPLQRIKARKDSLNKEYLKKRHVISR